ncbi:hypothetical protein LCGC14_1951330 [marine sediment metagenome]|uniref:ATPase AAA-type core domain-containing protein n=1 Tax=marine sediment metagenome TaxID=412755 RepID=A0A0F9G5T0_9ZZZZ
MKFNYTRGLILFFDELPWIVTRKSGFLKALEHFWNHTFSKNQNAILVVCGSAASWMIEKIVYNKGGLHNRLTAQIRLEPFSLKETEQYLQYKNIDLDNLNKKYEIFISFIYKFNLQMFQIIISKVLKFEFSICLGFRY